MWVCVREREREREQQEKIEEKIIPYLNENYDAKNVTLAVKDNVNEKKGEINT